MSRTGWYATIPPSAAGFVRAADPRAAREDIHRHLDAFLDDPAPYIAMGQAGRRILEDRYGIEAYVAGCSSSPAPPPTSRRAGPAITLPTASAL